MSATIEQTIPTTTIAIPAVNQNPGICRYHLRGICRFGALCRFSHDLSGAEITNNSTCDAAIESATADKDALPSTSRSNWANAPVFVPSSKYSNASMIAEQQLLELGETDVDGASGGNTHPTTWAEVVGGSSSVAQNQTLKLMNAPGSLNECCPFESPCPYGVYCVYAIHLELCEMCDQHCLHPTDQGQRRKHNRECLQQHEQAMELSFAIARSKDKTCGICFDTIMEKAGREKRFGILPNCSHIFCLECIRKWRQAKQFEHKITRSCPECRVCSDFVCPSAFWVDTKEEKDKLLNDYRAALGAKDCKYFKKGDGKCPFGNKCFYKHALPNGDIVDVGCPKRARKLRRSTNEIIDLLDIYLWEFVDQRDYHWLELLSNSSDDSDDSDYSEEV